MYVHFQDFDVIFKKRWRPITFSSKKKIHFGHGYQRKFSSYPTIFHSKNKLFNLVFFKFFFSFFEKCFGAEDFFYCYTYFSPIDCFDSTGLAVELKKELRNQLVPFFYAEEGLLMYHHSWEQQMGLEIKEAGKLHVSKNK